MRTPTKTPGSGPGDVTERALSEIGDVFTRLGAQTTRALEALASFDLEALSAALAERDDLLGRSEAMLRDLTTRPTPRGTHRQAWGRRVMEGAEQLREVEARLEVALAAARTEIEQQLDALDRERTRTGRYRSPQRAGGTSVDFRR